MEIADKKITIAEMLENTDKYDLSEFLVNKINFLKDCDYLNSTQINMLRMFINYTLQHELYNEKDLYMFDKKELVDVLASINTSSVRIKKNLESLISNYINYCIGRSMIPTNINPMTSILEDETRNINKKKLRSKYVTIDECFDIYNEALSKGNVTAQDAIIVLLARYGVTSEEISNLDINDIDRQNNRLVIRDDGNKIIRFVPIDGRLLNKLDEAIATTEYMKNKARRSYVENGLVLKPANPTAIIVSYVVIRKRFFEVMKLVDKQYINMKDLNKCYIIDRVLEINEQQGFLYNEDIKTAMIMAGREPNSSYFSLKEDILVMKPDLDIRKADKTT